MRNAFSSFLSRQDLHNTSEAIKTYLLEDYTEKALVNFIKEKNLGDTVDLVEGGHITLFRTEEEETNAKKDYEAAKAAGLGSNSDGDMGVRWIATEELTKVSLIIFCQKSILNYVMYRNMASALN